jgi:hypothetical protein
MGVPGILDHLQQIRPKLVFEESAVLYNSKVRDQMKRNRECARSLLHTAEFKKRIVLPMSRDVAEEQDLKLIS